MIPQRWRDDPLSGMLTVAAVILLILYGLEEYRRSVVDDGNLKLQTIGVPDQACRLSTTGLRGEVLVLTCPTYDLEKTRRLGATIKHDFESVYIVSNDARTEL